MAVGTLNDSKSVKSPFRSMGDRILFQYDSPNSNPCSPITGVMITTHSGEATFILTALKASVDRLLDDLRSALSGKQQGFFCGNTFLLKSNLTVISVRVSINEDMKKPRKDFDALIKVVENYCIDFHTMQAKVAEFISCALPTQATSPDLTSTDTKDDTAEPMQTIRSCIPKL